MSSATDSVCRPLSPTAAVDARLGELLRLLRRARGFSVPHVVDLCGGRFTVATLVAWEQAEQTLSVELVHTLACAYGVGTAWLLEEAVTLVQDDAGEDRTHQFVPVHAVAGPR